MSMRAIAPVTNVATDSFRVRVPVWGARKLPLGSVHADPPRRAPPLTNRKVEVKRGAALSPFRHDERD
jgi:hypothetical protein